MTMAGRSQSSLALTVRGQVLAWLAAASLLGAVLSDDDNVRLAAALVTAPLLVDLLWKPRGLSRVSVAVASRRTVAGAPFRDELMLAHRGRGAVRELLVSEPGRSVRPGLVDALPAGAHTRLLLDCQSHQRGRLRERAFALACDWPLGLVRARALVHVATDLVTEPARVPIDPGLLLTLAEHEPRSDHDSRRHGDEFHALREHAFGEDGRGVHALRSAALGQLVQTVRRGLAPREVGLVVDLRRPPGRSLRSGQRRCERQLGVAASALDQLRRRGAAVQAFVLGETVQHFRVADAAPHLDLLTCLAEAALCLHRPLEPATAHALAELDPCYWIAAGGQHPQQLFAVPPPHLHLLGAGPG